MYCSKILKVFFVSIYVCVYSIYISYTPYIHSLVVILYNTFDNFVYKNYMYERWFLHKVKGDIFHFQIFCWGTFNLYIGQSWDWITEHTLGLSCLCLSCCLQCLLQNWGLSASPASQIPSLLCSMFPVGNTKAAVCAFVPVSGFAYPPTHTFLLLFLKRKANFVGSREEESWKLFPWAGGSLWRKLSVWCFHGTWTILSEGKTEAMCVY